MNNPTSYNAGGRVAGRPPAKNPQSLSINIPVRVEARHCNPLLKRQRARRGGKR